MWLGCGALNPQCPCTVAGSLLASGSNQFQGGGQAVWFGGRPGPPETSLRFAHLLCEYCAEWLRKIGFVRCSGSSREGAQRSAIGG
jgi:hypothetical protein